jgi:peroxiredoxin
MAATPSNMMPLGTTAPAFTLPNVVDDSMVSLNDTEAPATVVAFICNHCPYVLHIIDVFVDVASDLQGKGARVIAISSNDVATYPMDGPDKMKVFARDRSFTFPYLYDETQEVARAYMAACTPDLYVFDGDLRCTYRGRFDGATPGNTVEVTGEMLRAAVEATMQGRPVEVDQIPSIGCNIKWK